MKKYFILSFLLFSNSILMAQNLTLEKAKEIAHQLYEIELLSKKGENQLLQEIEKNQTENKSDSVEKSFVLRFLYNAFDVDSYYRGGLFTQKQYFNYLKESDAISENDNLLIEEKEKLMNELEKKYRNSERMEIEKAIKNEEKKVKKYDSTGGWTVYPPLYTSEENINIINKNRSVLGKTTTRTLNDLFKLGLVDKVTFEEISQKINKEYLRGEREIIRLILEKT